MDESKVVLVPKVVEDDPRAKEMARMWDIDGTMVVSLNVDAKEDPAMWGIRVADFIRHLARAYEGDATVANRIIQGLNAELSHPTN
ncbi:MAG: DUF5076 domain-containing protein [Myxococcota bacterium]